MKADFFESPVLERLARCFGSGLQLSGPQRLDLLFDDDLAVQVFHETGPDELAADVWCHDAGRLAGERRRVVVEALLRINHVALYGPPFRVGLDRRDFIVLHARVPADGVDGDAFLDWLDGLLVQARRVRELARLLGLDGVPVGPLGPAGPGEQP